MLTYYRHLYSGNPNQLNTNTTDAYWSQIGIFWDYTQWWVIVTILRLGPHTVVRLELHTTVCQSQNYAFRTAHKYEFQLCAVPKYTYVALIRFRKILIRQFSFTKVPCRQQCWSFCAGLYHDDIIKWRHFPRYWPFVRGYHRSPVIFPHKGQWRWALMFSLICAWINRWVNNGDAGDLRRYRAHYDVILMHV